MNITEICLIGILGLGAYKGYSQGLLKQVAFIVGLVISYFFASAITGYVHQFLLENKILSANVSTTVSFIITILLIIVGIKFLAKFIEAGLKTIGLNFTNKFAGILFGIIRNALIISIVLYFVNFLNAEMKFLSEEAQQGPIYSTLTEVGNSLLSYFFK